MAAAAALALAHAPVASAAGLSASDLAGSGSGFRDFSIDSGPNTATSGAVGGILGGLDTLGGGTGAARPDIRLQAVPEGLAPTATAPIAPSTTAFPRAPSLNPVVPLEVPTPRLRPVGDTLPTYVPAASSAPAGAVNPQTAPTPAATPTGGAAQTQTPRPSPIPALDPDAPQPTLIRADELQHERDLGIYSARGNVELTNGPRIVLADMVSYNERTDILTANGNVRVVETDGTTYFANYAELSSDFKDGFVRDITVLLADRSRISAVYATRTAGERKDFWKGVYTACDTCPTSDDSPWPTVSGNEAGARDHMTPIWQVRAAEVTHDEVAHDIIYRDATLEVFGIPVAYTPYLEQPDPTVYRRTGLLSPIYGKDAVMGYWTEVPYYVVIDEQQDTTLAIRGMTEEAWLIRPEYRMRFAEGELAVDGSLTDDSSEGMAGHLNSRGRWAINDIWRAGFDSQLASSDQYRNRYKFENPDWLTNHTWVEAFSGRNYASMEGFYYNDTRQDSDDATNPIVLPLVTYDYESEPGFLGGQTLLDSSLQSIQRAEGASSTRLSGSLGWRRPGATGWGLAYETQGRLNADIFSVKDANTTDGSPESGFDGWVSRFYPSALVTARYPMVRVAPEHQQILEPIVSIAMAPPGLNTKHVPNEDSQVPEINLSNLFSGDRTAGRDRIDDGVSVNYGLNWRYVDNDGGLINAQVGQAYRFFDERVAFGNVPGYGVGLSDYMGSLDLRPSPYLDLYARAWLDRKDLSPTTEVIGLSVGPSALRFSGTYVNATGMTAEDGEVLPRREEIAASVSAALSRYWSGHAGGHYDLIKDRTSSLWSGVSYEDECLILSFEYSNDFNDESGESDSTSLLLRVTLKTLGEMSF